MSDRRAHRVSDLIREVVGEVLLRELKDPRLESVTITDVEVTDDLKMAKIFFSAMGIRAREEASLHGFQSAAGYLKRRLGKELRLKYIPDLSFQVDRSFEYGTKIDQLIRAVQAEKDEEPEEDR
jgi:ribosome-binding factor A